MAITTLGGKTIVPGNFYVSDGTTTVEIFSAKIDYNYDNAVGEIPIAVTPNQRDVLESASQEPYARIIDLKRIKEAISVQGVLGDESTESANTKRNNLLALGKTGGELTIVWNTGNYQTLWLPETNPKDGTGAFIKKMMFTETAGIYGENVTGDSQPERKIDVQLQVIRGMDIGNR